MRGRGPIGARYINGGKQIGDIHIEDTAQGFEGCQRDILILILDAHDGGLCHANLAGELPLRSVSPLLSDVACQAPTQMNHKWFILDGKNHMGFKPFWKHPGPGPFRGSGRRRAACRNCPLPRLSRPAIHATLSTTTVPL